MLPATPEQRGSKVLWSPSEGSLQDRGQLPTAVPCSLMPLSDFPSLRLLTFSLPQHISWGHLPKEPLNTESPLGKTQTKTSPAMHVRVCIVFLHWPESFFRNWVLFFTHRAQHRAGAWNKGGSSRMAKVVPALGCVVASRPCPELKIMHDREQSLSCPPRGWEWASSWHQSVQEESQHQHGGEGVSPKPLLLFYPSSRDSGAIPGGNKQSRHLLPRV